MFVRDDGANGQPQPPVRRALVAGATGYLGRFLVRELKRRGYWVRVLVRRPEQAREFPDADDVFVGQITDAATIGDIAATMDVVYSTVGITRQRDGFTYDDVDYRGNLNLLKEAERAHVERFVYVSILHGPQLRHIRLIAAKERFVDALIASSVAHTVIRPTGFFSDMGEFVHMAKRGRVYLIGDGSLRMNPIAGEDLAVCCVDAAEKADESIEVGGPDVYSHDEIAMHAFHAVDGPVRILHLPVRPLRVVLSILRLVTPVSVYGPVEFFFTVMTTEMVASRCGSHHIDDCFAELANEVSPS